ncbi:hypothetical protein CYMTET_33941 [Cymbomonas tetramitiformis]|uniref:Cyclic nucleotide-binding domain-containing protein n=1 Tax=Cymbomonas tetramitiformis TaxID=36881 RepID=A0AAE0KQP9_9CHLO|nr:hypothetical protein CYMTET_33941 [Cymbomonas tetramitiformis]
MAQGDYFGEKVLCGGRDHERGERVYTLKDSVLLRIDESVLTAAMNNCSFYLPNIKARVYTASVKVVQCSERAAWYTVNNQNDLEGGFDILMESYGLKVPMRVIEVWEARVKTLLNRRLLEDLAEMANSRDNTFPQHKLPHRSHAYQGKYTRQLLDDPQAFTSYMPGGARWSRVAEESIPNSADIDTINDLEEILEDACLLELLPMMRVKKLCRRSLIALSATELSAYLDIQLQEAIQIKIAVAKTGFEGSQPIAGSQPARRNSNELWPQNPLSKLNKLEDDLHEKGMEEEEGSENTEELVSTSEVGIEEKLGR